MRRNYDFGGITLFFLTRQTSVLFTYLYDKRDNFFGNVKDIFSIRNNNFLEKKSYFSSEIGIFPNKTELKIPQKSSVTKVANGQFNFSFLDSVKQISYELFLHNMYNTLKGFSNNMVIAQMTM